MQDDFLVAMGKIKSEVRLVMCTVDRFSHWWLLQTHTLIHAVVCRNQPQIHSNQHSSLYVMRNANLKISLLAESRRLSLKFQCWTRSHSLEIHTQ